MPKRTQSSPEARSAHKLDPMLRVVANGSDAVNALRADSSGCVASVYGAAEPTTGAPGEALGEALAVSRRALRGDLLDPEAARPTRERQRRSRPPLEEAGSAAMAFVNVFVEAERDEPGERGTAEKVRQALDEMAREGEREGLTGGEGSGDGGVRARGNLLAATVPVSRLADIARTDGVAFVHRAEGLRFHPPTPATADSGPPARVAAPARSRLRLAADAPAGDSRVLVGLIDVGGFDFAHPDFLDADGNTRFLRIWDQRGAFRPPPAGFAFGSEFTRERMNAALRAGRERGWSPHLIEPQADRVRGSHATHVASIAAGNRGVCPAADIVGVSVYLPREDDPDEERRRAFSDSSRITEAVEYLLGVAEAEGCPISINVSLGTNGGSHDGANATCRWLDHALASPGRTICIAGGNAGQESGETDDDTGWIFGRIHASGRIPARGLERVLEWVVVGNGVADFSENEMEIWLGPQDRFTVSVLPPGAAEWITVRPREFLLNHSLPNGTYLSVHNELYYAANGANYIAIYLSPRWDPASLSPVAAGTWRVRLTGEEVRDGRFHAWIERDDPVYRGPFGGAQAYSFPSFFAQATNVDTHSLNSLACSPRAVAVANLDEARQRIHRSSSQGPTRDDRNKPDIAAPGTEIVAAFGFPEEGDGEWVAMTGTSMASPYVAGVLARMLAVRPDLTAAQCLGILQRTARPLPSHAYDWRDDAGFGCIAPEEALREAATFHVRSELTL